MKIVTVVVAHHSRMLQATKLAKKTDALLSVDFVGVGSTKAHINALELAKSKGATHALILEDDSKVCDSLSTVVDKLVETNPKDLISLYLGTSRPPQYQSLIDMTLMNRIGMTTTLKQSPPLTWCHPRI